MKLYTPKVAAAFSFDGRDVIWRPGQLIQDGAPILKGREGLVRDVVVDYPAPKAVAKKPAAKAVA